MLRLPGRTAAPYSKTNNLAGKCTGQTYINEYNPDGTPIILASTSGAVGTPSPDRYISRGFANATTAMTTDIANQLYVVGQAGAVGAGSVLVLPADAGVSTGYLRLLTLSESDYPLAVAVDISGNIYVACWTGGPSMPTGSIYVFNTVSDTPARIITSASIFSGIAVDAASNIFAVENSSIAKTTATTNNEALVEFSPEANGAATPLKTISGTATGMIYGGAVGVDAAGNIFLVNLTTTSTADQSGTGASILAFGPTATGNEPPAGVITSSAWTSPSTQIALF